jgi:hypothetical protein
MPEKARCLRPSPAIWLRIVRLADGKDIAGRKFVTELPDAGRDGDIE